MQRERFALCRGGGRLEGMKPAWLPLALVFVASAACGPGPGSLCQCSPCTAAITLTVVDARDNTAIDNFSIEAVANGTPLGEPNGCRAEDRTDNTCSFGLETGLYHLVVTAPGYATREAVVRLAEPGGGDLCCRACLNSEETTLGLDPL